MLHHNEPHSLAFALASTIHIIGQSTCESLSNQPKSEKNRTSHFFQRKTIWTIFYFDTECSKTIASLVITQIFSKYPKNSTSRNFAFALIKIDAALLPTCVKWKFSEKIQVSFNEVLFQDEHVAHGSLQLRNNSCEMFPFSFTPCHGFFFTLGRRARI